MPTNTITKLDPEFEKWMKLVETWRDQLNKSKVQVTKRYELKKWQSYLKLLVNYLNSKLSLTLSDWTDQCSEVFNLLNAIRIAINNDWKKSIWKSVIPYLDISHLSMIPTEAWFKKIVRQLPEDFVYNNLENKDDIMSYYSWLHDILRKIEAVDSFALELTRNNSPIAIDNKLFVIWEFCLDISTYLSQFNTRAHELGLLPLDQETLVDKCEIRVDEKIIRPWDGKKKNRGWGLKPLTLKERRIDKLFAELNDLLETAKLSSDIDLSTTLVIYRALQDWNKIRDEQVYKRLSIILKDNIDHILSYYTMFNNLKIDLKNKIEYSVISILCLFGFQDEADRFVTCVCKYSKSYILSQNNWYKLKQWSIIVQAWASLPEIIEWKNNTSYYLGHLLFHKIYVLFRDWYNYEAMCKIFINTKNFETRLNMKIWGDRELLLSSVEYCMFWFYSNQILCMSKLLEKMCIVATTSGLNDKEMLQFFNTLINSVENFFWENAYNIILGSKIPEYQKIYSSDG